MYAALQLAPRALMCSIGSEATQNIFSAEGRPGDIEARAWYLYERVEGPAPFLLVILSIAATKLSVSVQK